VRSERRCLLGGIKLRRQDSNRLDRSAAVRCSDHNERIKSITSCPRMPRVADALGGVDKDSIEVEEDRVTFELR